MITGFRIKERRQHLGMSADQLAESLGVNRSTIFRYEKGDIEKVPATTLAHIAELLHTSSHYLMGWTDDETEEAPDTDLLSRYPGISRETVERFSPLLEQLSQDDLEKVYELAQLLLLKEQQEQKGDNGA